MAIKNLLSKDLREELEVHGIEKFLDSLGKERLKQKKTRMENIYLHPSLTSNSITRIVGAQVFCDKKNDARGIIISIRRYMGLILLYYENKGIEEE